MRIPLVVPALGFVFVAGCGGKGGGGGNPPVTIHGVVRAFSDPSSSNPFPAPGVVVITSGQQPVITGGDGSFTVTVAKTPYDLTVIDGANHHATVWKGLTRTDPVIAAESALDEAGTVGGNVLGNGAALAVFGADGVAALPYHVTPMGTYTSGATWRGAATLSGNVYAWDFVGNDGTGVFGAAPVTLTAGTPVTGVNVTTAAVSPAAATSVGVTGLATGYAGTISLDYDDAGVPAIPAAAVVLTSNGTATLVPPALPGNTFDADARVTAMGGAFQQALLRGLAPGAASLSVALHAVPTQALPVDAATGVSTATPFSWQATDAPAVYVMVLVPSINGQPTYRIVTGGTSANIPDLTLEGLPLPSSASYSWYVLALGPFTGVDAAAANGASMPATGAFFESGSTPRTITTAP